jgi:hypothetical protein
VAQQVLNDPGASDEQRAQANAALANAGSTLAAEQQNYENWKEGGASRVWAHALVGGLEGRGRSEKAGRCDVRASEVRGRRGPEQRRLRCKGLFAKQRD